MGRAPCCDKANVKKGPWSPEEDAKLKEHIEKEGTGGNWIAFPQKAGLKRCGKSCRLRWLNYLRPNIKHGEFSDDEDRIICSLYANIGSRWSIIAAQLPGRTDNDIKNYWNTKLKKKLIGMINNPRPIINSHRKPQQAPTHFSLSSSPSTPLSSSSSSYTCSNNNSTTTYNYRTTPLARSFTEPTIPFSSSPLTNNMLLQSPQDQSFVGPMQHYHHHQVRDSLIMFGGGGVDQAASCSSSDGSCGANNNSAEQLGLQSYLYNGVEEDQKLQMVSNGLSWVDNNPVLDYGLEEIKQLLSSSTSSCNNNSFLFDENKTDQERVMYYY